HLVRKLTWIWKKKSNPRQEHPRTRKPLKVFLLQAKSVGSSHESSAKLLLLLHARALGLRKPSFNKDPRIPSKIHQEQAWKKGRKGGNGGKASQNGQRMAKSENLWLLTPPQPSI